LKRTIFCGVWNKVKHHRPATTACIWIVVSNYQTSRHDTDHRFLQGAETCQNERTASCNKRYKWC